MMTTQTILHLNSSGRYQGSVTRDLSLQLVEQLAQQTGLSINSRDLASGLPFIDEQWINANFTDPEVRTEADRAALALSDNLVAELQQASHLVIAVPIYNFSVPSVLKAWIDLVARARLTFRYTENGPEGLLKGKKAYLVIASGGVPVGSEVDFASRYLQQIMTFLGIDDVTVIDAASLNSAANDTNTVQTRLAAITASG
ncbi:FMN-dependent NADH-azoreductase [Methylophaga sp. OBS4]|uniref:FMN-dependent NADH-azoreductase n=1 Tax=Methylophaga sp. OBS4 TaxID=2991935 RepID=UPI002251772E|nr:NAD(P)H-dependent oxidoreductase [Methylophaga sp. OBS4]MCX4188257.1 NAD(P)H-dependent oxidoreductase [Methylophaga sp. OBS4]